MRRREVLMLAAGGIAMLAGCETIETAETAEALSSAQQNSNQSIAFGRLRWIENGAERQIDQSMFGWSIAPRLKRLEDRKIMNAQIDAGGHFIWSLPPGTYMIDRINYRDPMTGNYFLAPKFAFKVPATGRSYYAGTMRVDAVSSRDFLGTLDADVRYSVEDNLSQETAYLRRKLGSNLGTVEKSLMVHDARLPQSIDTTSEAQIALTILGGML